MSSLDELDIYIPHAVIEMVSSLEEEIERLRADAERYRWLRGESCADHSVRWMQWEIRCWQAPRWSDDLRRTDLDAAIDAAMKEQKE